MSTFAKNMLTEQRKRLVGSLMGHIETHVYPHLPVHEREELRKKVLTSTSQYHDVCLDMIKASVVDGSVVNDEALRLLSKIHRQVSNLGDV